MMRQQIIYTLSFNDVLHALSRVYDLDTSRVQMIKKDCNEFLPGDFDQTIEIRLWRTKVPKR